MPVGWFLAPYRLRETGADEGSAAGAHVRYCALDDYTEHVEGWHEAEVLGDHALVGVRAASAVLHDLAHEASLHMIRTHLSVHEPMETQPTRIRRRTQERLAGLGYAGHEIDRLGRGLREATLGEVLAFTTQRRYKPLRLDVVNGRTVFTAEQAPVTPVEALIRRALAPVGGAVVGPGVRFFPSNTTVLDNFNRTAVNPISTAGTAMTWATNQINAAVARTLQIPTGGIQVSAASAAAGNAFSTNTWGPDVEFFITFATLSSYIAMFGRLQQAGAAGTYDGYALVVDTAATPDSWTLRRYDNAVATTLGAAVTQNIAANDLIGFDVIGMGAAMQTAAYWKSGSLAWSQMFTRNDSTYTAANALGLECGNNTLLGDNLSGGTANFGAFRRPISYPPMATAVMLGVGIGRAR